MSSYRGCCDDYGGVNYPPPGGRMGVVGGNFCSINSRVCSFVAKKVWKKGLLIRTSFLGEGGRGGYGVVLFVAVESGELLSVTFLF